MKFLAQPVRTVLFRTNQYLTPTFEIEINH